MSGHNLPLMAWRNLWRNRRRTLITLSSIIFGVFFAVMMAAMQDRNWDEMIDLGARLGGGHVTIQHVDYRETPSLKLTVQNTAQLVDLAHQQAPVEKITQRISGPVMLNTAGASYGAGFIAFDPQQEDASTLSLLTPEALAEGALFQRSDEKGIILGQRLAQNLGADLGDKVIYTFTDKSGEIVSGLARLSGVVRTGAPGLDASLALLPLDTTRKILGYTSDEASQLAIFIEDQRDSSAIAQQIGQALGNQVDVLPWSSARPELAAFVAMKVGGARFASALIALLVAAGIFNTLFVSVMERLREFGILMALGFTPLRLFGLVMFESLWLALVGLFGAALFTLGPYLYLESIGVDISAMMAEQGTMDIAGVAMSTTLKVGIFQDSLILIVVFALFATLLAGLYPAWRAGTVDPVDSIKLV
ncbi:MAG: FtsX-like permease family protein [Pseudomonadota bacterium]